MKEALSYDDVLLVPKFSDIDSRKEIDIGNILGDRDLTLPIISSPMDTVTWTRMTDAMGHSGGLAVLHRYCSIEDQCRSHELSLFKPACAVGISGDFKERVDALDVAGCTMICIDVAHGHHKNVADAIKHVKAHYPHMHVMAGNVATPEGYWFLSQAGANSVRVGIGGGSICSTRIRTGHGIPAFQSLLDIGNSAQNYLSNIQPALIIADGGIKNSGDIVKALAAGADFVMLGSLLAGTDETPGEVIQSDDGLIKAYRGMASVEAQTAWRGKIGSEEGVSSFIPHKGSVREILNSLAKGIRSGFSYSGARNMYQFHEKAEFIIQTSAGQYESSTHINGR